MANFEVRFAAGPETLAARGEALQGYDHYLGDADRFGWHLTRLRGFTPAKLQQLPARNPVRLR